MKRFLALALVACLSVLSADTWSGQVRPGNVRLEQPRPILDLRFAADKQLDSRIDFSATTNRMHYNSAGTLVYAPHNLVLQSDTFATTGSAWTHTSTTVTTSATTAPNGTETGVSYEHTVAHPSNPILQGNLGAIYNPGAEISFTAHLKQSTNRWVRFQISTASAGPSFRL